MENKIMGRGINIYLNLFKVPSEPLEFVIISTENMDITNNVW